MTTWIVFLSSDISSSDYRKEDGVSGNSEWRKFCRFPKSVILKLVKLPYFPLKDEKTMKSIDAKKKMCIM